MPNFTYKAVSSSGDGLDGQMEARDQDAVVERLHGMGYIPIRIEMSAAAAGRPSSRSLLGGGGIGTAAESDPVPGGGRQARQTVQQLVRFKACVRGSHGGGV